MKDMRDDDDRKYANGRKCMKDVLAQKQTKDFYFWMGLVDEFASYILDCDLEEVFIDVLGHIKKIEKEKENEHK